MMSLNLRGRLRDVNAVADMSEGRRRIACVVAVNYKEGEEGAAQNGLGNLRLHVILSD